MSDVKYCSEKTSVGKLGQESGGDDVILDVFVTVFTGSKTGSSSESPGTLIKRLYKRYKDVGGRGGVGKENHQYFKTRQNFSRSFPFMITEYRVH